MKDIREIDEEDRGTDEYEDRETDSAAAINQGESSRPDEFILDETLLSDDYLKGLADGKKEAKKQAYAEVFKELDNTICIDSVAYRSIRLKFMESEK